MTATSRLFSTIVDRPWLFLLPLALLLLLSVTGLRLLKTDTRSDAFLSPDNPALVYREVVREQFGQSDPMLVAIVATGPNGIYTPEILRLVKELSGDVATLENIDAENTLSLATESLITGNVSGIEVIPLLDPLPTSIEEANWVREQVDSFPLFLGSLAARDGTAALIAANLIDEDLAESTYNEILALLRGRVLPEGVAVHVAGEGAIAGYLGAYIDEDARKLNPIASVIIILTIVFAFRRLAPAMLAVVIILASVSSALGSMAYAGIPFFVITNALPVILIGISVADTIHIFSHFYDAQAASPQTQRRELIISTMQAMWLPVTITSITTAAGFLGLYFAATMPPFRYFGLFAAIGVGAAWLYSLVALPALMMLCKVQVAQHFINQRRAGNEDRLSGVLHKVGSFTLAYPRLLVISYSVIAVVGAFAASQLVVDADRIKLFNSSEPIVVADSAINARLNGSNTLDIVIETPEVEGVLDPEVLALMDDLQQYALTLPHVKGANSIVDYLKQMNRVINGGGMEVYRIPETREEAAQYMLLYSFSADPEDFAQEIDYDYRTANVRVTMNHGGYLQIKEVYESLEQYVSTHFVGSQTASLSGRLSVNYHWIKGIGDSHFGGLAVALILVCIVSALSFKSVVAGGYTLVPVIAAVLFVYAFMVLQGLTLGVGTSMFAAVAIGLGVDFAIHTLSRLRSLQSEGDGSSAEMGAGVEAKVMYLRFFVTTGRALLLNVLAVACGFAVLLVSQVGQLRDFGSIVVISMLVAFLASVTLLPALVLLGKPAFMSQTQAAPASSIAGFLVLVLALGALGSQTVFAQNSTEFSDADSQSSAESYAASEVVAKVNAVSQGEQVSRNLLFRTTDKKGRTRERDTRSFRRYFGEERRLALFFTAPANIKDTAVLTWDYPNTTDDDQWLYLSALRKVRRIPASDRGDFFLGTDFSFEDMKLDGQLSVADYKFELAPAPADGFLKLVGIPKSEEIAAELGYSRTESIVDASNWVVTQADFWDKKGHHLKTLLVADIRPVDGVLTRHHLTMRNHKTGHTTELLFSDVDYLTPIDDGVFTQQALKRGL